MTELNFLPHPKPVSKIRFGTSAQRLCFDISFRDNEVSLELRYVFTLTDSISLKKKKEEEEEDN